MTLPTTETAINYQALTFWISASNFLLVWAFAGIGYWVTRDKVTSRRFAALEKEVAERLKKNDLDEAKANRDKLCIEHKSKTESLNKAYADLHIEVTRLPDRREITRLDGSIKDLSEKIGNLQGSLKGINRVADLMNEFLINQGGK